MTDHVKLEAAVLALLDMYDRFPEYTRYDKQLDDLRDALDASPEPDIAVRLWLVSDPGPESELVDILYHPGERLFDWCMGTAGEKPMPAVTLYVDEDAARAEALLRIHKRDHPDPTQDSAPGDVETHSDNARKICWCARCSGDSEMHDVCNQYQIELALSRIDRAARKRERFARSKAHAAGRAERDREWREKAEVLLDLHDPEYYYGLTALIDQLTEAGDG